MVRKKRDTSRKREAILDAAVEAFRDEGYDNTSMDRIAEIAAASKRTVYNHFPSKDILFQAVFDRFIEETNTLKRVRYDASRSLETQLSEFADAKLALFENPAWLGLMKVALTTFIRDTELARLTMSKYEEGENSLAIWLKSAAADGRLDVTNATLSATVFWSMVSGALIWPQLLSGALTARQITALKKELIKTFLCRHLP